ncbi:MAG: imidazole glycerol phosphate synthase subunit HisF [Chloroflexi bacterium]|nr:MAG: imidazole glycerol phosphate synthase subunit HisF [Chloroflexota bacterium]
MAGVRVIPRLDIKGPNLVKGINLEGLRVLGRPEEFARRYSDQGADELIYVDIVASLYQRNNLAEIVERTAAEIFVPLTVGGGVRTTDDVARLLRAGADKVAINTAAIGRPVFLREAARMFGSQCVVLSIEAKRRGPSSWEAYTDNGREPSGRDVVEWAREGVNLGAGEVLVTSVDQEGTGRGYDIDLVNALATGVPVPVIACGGAGKPADVVEVVRRGKADAVAMARMLHYGHFDVASIKTALSDAGVEVRT